MYVVPTDSKHVWREYSKRFSFILDDLARSVQRWYGMIWVDYNQDISHIGLERRKNHSISATAVYHKNEKKH